MKIVNVRDYGGISQAKQAGVIYCGRPSILGNPYHIGQYTRGEAIELYRLWLWKNIKEGNNHIIRAIQDLRADSVLGCWCVPLECHCSVIIRAWEWMNAINHN